MGRLENYVCRWAIHGADEFVALRKSWEAGSKVLVALLACVADRQGGAGGFPSQASEVFAALIPFHETQDHSVAGAVSEDIALTAKSGGVVADIEVGVPRPLVVLSSVID